MRMLNDKLLLAWQVCMRWMAEPRAAPKEDEVTVQIKAAGLNFRDVLLAMRYVT
jgi:NADPH:quinone reductase-like Zn-dependent oxidoreductase